MVNIEKSLVIVSSTQHLVNPMQITLTHLIAVTVRQISLFPEKKYVYVNMFIDQKKSLNPMLFFWLFLGF